MERERFSREDSARKQNQRPNSRSHLRPPPHRDGRLDPSRREITCVAGGAALRDLQRTRPTSLQAPSPQLLTRGSDPVLAHDGSSIFPTLHPRDDIHDVDREEISLARSGGRPGWGKNRPQVISFVSRLDFDPIKSPPSRGFRSSHGSYTTHRITNSVVNSRGLSLGERERSLQNHRTTCKHRARLVARRGTSSSGGMKIGRFVREDEIKPSPARKQGRFWCVHLHGYQPRAQHRRV